MSKGFDVNVKTDEDKYVIPSDLRGRKVTLNLENCQLRLRWVFIGREWKVDSGMRKNLGKCWD